MRLKRLGAIVASTAAAIVAGCGGQSGPDTGPADASRIDVARDSRSADAPAVDAVDGATDTAVGMDVPVVSACVPACGPHSHCDDGVSPVRCACDADYQDLDHDGSCNPTCALAQLACTAGQLCSDRNGTAHCETATRPPIYISFLWHMHQPIYWPYESVTATINANRYPFALLPIFTDRTGPYTNWPRDAVQSGAALPSLGAQVSLSGSLIENLENLRRDGVAFANWSTPWRDSASLTTTLGHPRLDLVSFPYHHPVMPLIATRDARLQLQLHRQLFQRVFGRAPGPGIFPAECAFSERIIPALQSEGIRWSFVDNIHFERAHVDYPWVAGSNLPPPNGADQVDATPTTWTALQNIWAPSRVGAPWSYRPHWSEYTDPDTGAHTRVIAVPAARYEGNEDARGGFGALQYEAVFSQIEALNTDPAHPILIVLHHDGDNYGGGTDSYYGSNFQAFVAWATANTDRFVPTTIEDYLQRFPPDPDDVIHVEDGSWSGADNGDAQFSKWNGAPGTDGYSPDVNSWASVIAARNRVWTADSIQPMSSIDAVLDGTGSDTEQAWHALLNAEASDYWYWDGSAGGIWDSHPTRAGNAAIAAANRVLGPSPNDHEPPSLYPPQRVPYNPGVNGAASDVRVWTLAYDVSGIASVTLRWRVDTDGVRTAANERISTGGWTDTAMAIDALPPSRTDPTPVARAERYATTIPGTLGALVDYYVVATDARGLSAHSDLFHVRIGSTGSTPTMPWSPATPTRADTITITWNRAGQLHWGVDTGAGPWHAPPASVWPAGSTAWPDGMAIETPLVGPDASGNYTARIGPFTGTSIVAVQFVVHYPDNTWSSPNQSFAVTP